MTYIFIFIATYIDAEYWMKQYLGGTNDGACINYGYRKLTYNGQTVTITSGNYGSDTTHYGTYEYCYWAIYAPGAQSLRFELQYLNV